MLLKSDLILFVPNITALLGSGCSRPNFNSRIIFTVCRGEEDHIIFKMRKPNIIWLVLAEFHPGDNLLDIG